MKIFKDYTESEVIDTVEIIHAKDITENTIEIYFSDNTVRIVDFKPFLTKSLHPSITKYLDSALFSTFEIKNGNLNWNDFELIFPVHDLYEGKVYLLPLSKPLINLHRHH